MAQKKKQRNKKRYQSESSSQEEKKQGDESDPSSETEEAGCFYLKFREPLPPLVRKDLMIEDCWLLMKRPLVTN